MQDMRFLLYSFSNIAAILTALSAYAAKQSIHEKQEGLRFLHICLASVLNLRSPDDSELSGTPLDKLASMLFGTQVAHRLDLCSVHILLCHNFCEDKHAGSLCLSLVSRC